MAIERLFPTFLYHSRFAAKDFRHLNAQLEKESYVFRGLDRGGREWSKENYLGGYTSYSSLADLPFRSSTFDGLKRVLDREVMKFANALEWDLNEGRLALSTCWVNIMGRGAHHSFHLHPRSAVSGTYFVKVPKDAGVFKVEDPRMGRFMGSPPQKQKVKRENQRYVEFRPRAGDFVLFESWLKHEVPANRSKSDRISISFNYNWI